MEANDKSNETGREAGFQSLDILILSLIHIYSSTKYTVRAYMTYKDAEGKTIYVYSEPKRVSYNGLK